MIGNQPSAGDLLDYFWMRPADLRILSVIRLGIGLSLLPYVGTLWLIRHEFFGPGSLLPPTTASSVLDPDAYGLYDVFPNHPATITVALITLLACGFCLILKILPQLAALIAFVALTLIQHANCLLFDAEDTVLRLFCFYLIFAPPIGMHHSVRPKNKKNKLGETSVSPSYPIWPLRLFQLQFCVIYFCAAIQKSHSSEWLGGSAVYYALRLDDFTKFPLPSLMTESLAIQATMAWSVVLFEFAFPIFIWFARTRLAMVVLAAGFHLGTDYALNLHLFHPLMLIGLLSFIKYEEWQAWKQHALRMLPNRNTKGPKQEAWHTSCMAVQANERGALLVPYPYEQRKRHHHETNDEG